MNQELIELKKHFDNFYNKTGFKFFKTLESKKKCYMFQKGVYFLLIYNDGETVWLIDENKNQINLQLDQLKKIGDIYGRNFAKLNKEYLDICSKKSWELIDRTNVPWDMDL